jgi:hypothetical protein
MAFRINNTPQIPAPVPHDALLLYLVTVDKNALMLKYIHNQNAIFQSSIQYPIERGHKAVFTATATVPLATFATSTERISYVYPRFFQPFITFNFEHICNRNGCQVRSIN